jgi:hypothetical protein
LRASSDPGPFCFLSSHWHHWIYRLYIKNLFIISNQVSSKHRDERHHGLLSLPILCTLLVCTVTPSNNWAWSMIFFSLALFFFFLLSIRSYWWMFLSFFLLLSTLRNLICFCQNFRDYLLNFIVMIEGTLRNLICFCQTLRNWRHLICNNTYIFMIIYWISLLKIKEYIKD